MSSTNDNRIDYIEFGATDIPATKKFYSDVFGWKFTDYGPDYVSFEDGRLTGGFTKVETIAPVGTVVILYSSDLEGTLRAVERHRMHIVKPIFSFPGGRRFHFSDPNGNELAVWSDK